MAARRTILSALTVLAVGLSLLSGCTPAGPAGQPTYACTPDDGSTPYPCYKVHYDAKAKEAALYAEAEGVYRKFFAEHERINRAGGVTEPTQVLLETTTGDFLASAMTSYRGLKEIHGTAAGGEFVTVWIKHYPDGAAAGAAVAIQVCTDTHTVQMGGASGAPEPGLIIIRTLAFFRVDGVLKIGAGSFKKVTQC